MKNRILVIGGTGTVGSAVVTELKSKGEDFKVLTRNEDKAKELNENGIPSLVGTLGKWKSIEPILDEIDTLFLATSPAADMIDLHKGMIDLAVKKNIKKIIRLSAEPANYSDGLYMYEQHSEADDYLKKSGLEYVILRPHYFMQNIMMHVDYVKSQNLLAQYSGGAKIPMIDVRDIAKAACQSLTKNDFNGQTFVLTGPTSISYSDIVKNLSINTGRIINYVDLSFEEQESGFKAFGLQDWQLSTVMKLFKIWADKGTSRPTNGFERITGSKPTSINKFIDDYGQLFR